MNLLHYMSKLYRMLAKKATISLCIVAFLSFPSLAAAKEPNDPQYNKQKSMWDQINAPAAWDITTGSSQVVIATIDTGVDTWHGDLKQEIWTNSNEIPDNGIDDDRNGYIDDVHGWNFVEDTSDVRTSVFNDQDDHEVVRHGTIIAGLLGASGDNGLNGVGVNWDVKIMPLRALENTGTGSYATIARAVDYAVDNGASVLSLSFEGNIDNQMLKQSLYRAYKKGVVVVSAAGNHDPRIGGDLDLLPHYPACYDHGEKQNWMITVASVDSEDFLSDFSNYGGCVDIAAPGENLFSTERYAPQFGYNEEFGGGWYGTSFSTPLVAGTAALIRALRPEWNPDEVIKDILDNADPISPINSKGVAAFGSGRLNIGKAVQAAYQAKPEPQTLGGDLFYVQKNTIKQYSTNGQSITTFAVVNDADVKAVAHESVTESQYTAALVKRGIYYYVQLYDTSGAFTSEVPLRTTKKINDSHFDVNITRDNKVHYIFSSYDQKKKVTTFSEYDDSGVELKTMQFAGAVARWTFNDSKNTLMTAQLIGTKLAVTATRWGSGERLRWQTNGITAIDDVHMAALGTTANDSVMLVVRSGKIVKYVTLDSKFLGVRQEVLESKAVAPYLSWKLLVLKPSRATDTYVVRFQGKAGSYSYTGENGLEAGVVDVPLLPAQVFK